MSVPTPPAAKERGLLFSPEMMRALVEGRKYVTRRLATKFRVRLAKLVNAVSLPGDASPSSVRFRHGVHEAFISGTTGTFCIFAAGTPYGLKPGDFDIVCPHLDGTTTFSRTDDGHDRWTILPSKPQRYWARESWAVDSGWDLVKPSEIVADQKLCGGVWYPATYSAPATARDRGRTRVGRFMPRWASRHTRDAVSVRLERLQEITDEDILAEGIVAQRAPLRETWRVGWNIINGTRATWESDPLVWRIEMARSTS